VRVYLPYYDSEVFIHRLLALTFIPIPENSEYKELYVNHKNGIKHDNRLENLEWVTTKENINHALATGLQPQVQHVEAKNLLTNEILKFYSLGECGKYFGVLKATVWNWLHSKKTQPFHEYWILRYNYDDWIDVPDVKEYLYKYNPNTHINQYTREGGTYTFRKGTHKQTKLIDKKLNEVHMFDSVTEAYKYIGKLINYTFESVKRNLLYNRSLSNRFELIRMPES
jgi:hypothetical protein